MTDYSKLFSRIWNDKEFTSLDARQQQLFMLLLSFPTRNRAGVLPLTIKRWALATSDATPANVTKALEALIKARFILVDWDTEEVLIRTYIRNDEVYRQPNLMKATLGDVTKTDSLKLRLALKAALLGLPEHNTSAQTRAAANSLVETPAEPIGEPIGEPMPEGPGVGGYLSGVLTPTPTPTPSPTPAPCTGTKPPPSSGVSKGVTKRGERLPADWRPPTNVIRAMGEQFPHVNLRAEHDKFCDFWRAKAGQGALKVDWVATWRNWIRTAAEKTAPPAGAATRKAQGWDSLKEITPSRKEIE